MFIVIKDGVYRHEVRGLFSKIELAVKAGKTCALAEPDDYHDFLIGELVPDIVVDDFKIVATVERLDKEYVPSEVSWGYNRVDLSEPKIVVKYIDSEE